MAKETRRIDQGEKIEQNGQKKKKGAEGLGRFERRKHSQTSERAKERDGGSRRNRGEQIENDLPSLDEILHFLRPLDTAFSVVVQLRYRALDDDLQHVNRAEVRWIREFVVRELEERKTCRPNIRSNRIWSAFDAFRL